MCTDDNTKSTGTNPTKRKIFINDYARLVVYSIYILEQKLLYQWL